MAGLKTGPSTTGLEILVIPFVVVLVAFLGYTSQWLFHTAPDLQPGPLSRSQTVIFNVLLLSLWWNYYKACSVSPGTYTFPKPEPEQEEEEAEAKQKRQQQQQHPQRWCKKCAAPKPPRAHHCRHCRRCVPKMDHHCPWTGNCVSLQTFPYFVRFLVSTNLSLWYLGRLLYLRFRCLFDDRNLPAYLGPTPYQLVHLTLLTLVCAAVSLALAILLTTTVKSWVLNRTMIEDWEVERHEALLARHGVRAGRGSTWWATEDEEEEDEEEGEEEEDHDDESGQEDDGGRRAALKARAIEFPYDIGMWKNMSQAMGTANVLAWFWPFAGGPAISPEASRHRRGPGWEWEENGFNAREGMWPPPDPDKMRRARAAGGRWPGAYSAAAAAAAADVVLPQYATPEEEVAAFRARQERDLLRWAPKGGHGGRSGIIAELEETEELADLAAGDGGHGSKDGDFDDGYGYYEHGLDGEPGWTNAEGERLRDYGVDEDAEVEVVDADGVPVVPLPVTHVHDDDEDVPLGELLRRRKAAAARASLDT